jgi:hypothetical protein
MKFLAFSDIHCDSWAIKKIGEKSREVDFLVCAGDISTFGKGMEQMCIELSKINKKILIIPGNSEKPEILSGLCDKYNLTYIHKKIERIGNYNFIGIGGSLPTPFHTPYEISEEEFKKMLTDFYKIKNIILVAHNPPYGTDLDKLLSHIGSKAIREFIEKSDVKLCICGHLHELSGKEDYINNKRIVNPGKEGMLIEI